MNDARNSNACMRSASNYFPSDNAAELLMRFPAIVGVFGVRSRGLFLASRPMFTARADIDDLKFTISSYVACAASRVSIGE